MPLNYHETFGLTTVTASTVTIDPKIHLGKPIILSRAAGITATLPASSGSGNSYRFLVLTTVTSNGYIIKVANSTDIMAGIANIAQDGGDTAVAFESGASDDTITMNGTTTGGVRGAEVVLTDMATGFWHVMVRSAATGTEATPFSATV